MYYSSEERIKMQLKYLQKLLYPPKNTINQGLNQDHVVIIQVILQSITSIPKSIQNIYQLHSVLRNIIEGKIDLVRCDTPFTTFFPEDIQFDNNNDLIVNEPKNVLHLNLVKKIIRKIT